MSLLDRCRRRPALLLLPAAAIYWLLLFALTHWPKDRLPDTPRIPASDKVVHFLGYAILAALLLWAAQTAAETWPRWRGGACWLRRGAMLVLAVVLVYGVFDELTQPLVGRTADVLDWVADAAGALCGLLLVRAWSSQRSTAARAAQATD